MYISAVQKQNAAVLFRKLDRLTSQYALIAASLTGIGFIESIAGALSDATKIDKRKCIMIVLIVIFFLNIPVILSYGIWSDFTVLGKNFFDLADYFSGNILLPWAGVILSLYIVFKWGFKSYMEDSNQGAKYLYVMNWWKPFVLVIVPLLSIIVAIGSTLAI